MKAREFLAELKKAPEFAEAYEELAPEFEIARQIIRLRVDLGLTQKELAEKIGTKQSNISRLENGVGHPSVSLLKRGAKALGTKLCIRFERPPVRPSQAKEPIRTADSLVSLQRPARVPAAEAGWLAEVEGV